MTLHIFTTGRAWDKPKSVQSSTGAGESGAQRFLSVAAVLVTH